MPETRNSWVLGLNEDQRHMHLDVLLLTVYSCTASTRNCAYNTNNTEHWNCGKEIRKTNRNCLISNLIFELFLENIIIVHKTEDVFIILNTIF